MIGIPEFSWTAIFPMGLLCLAGFAALVLGTGRGASSYLTGRLALFGVVLATVATGMLWGRPVEPFPGALILDRFALLLHLILLLACGATLLFSFAETDRSGRRAGEYYALVLFATVGMMILTAASHLLVVFLGLEILSIALYILAGFRRESAASVEAAMKYFILGAFSTCFILYGIAFLYGATGSLDLVEIGRFLNRIGDRPDAGYLQAGLAFLVVGFAFKIAAAPFHFWAPDVYQGAPTPIAGFMATATKAAALGALLRVLHLAFAAPEFRDRWTGVFALLAILTMATGNLIALAQDDVKRMLAYSSIAQVGYLLIAVSVGTPAAMRAILFYLITYSFMTLGAFGVLAWLGRRDGEEKPHSNRLREFTGLGRRRPWVGAAMALFMLSLTGIPPTAGFMGKFYIFRAAVGAGQMPIAIIGMVFSAISAYYYLQVIVYMYLRDGVRPAVEPGPAVAGAAGIALAAAGTLYLGLFPTRLWELVAGLL